MKIIWYPLQSCVKMKSRKAQEASTSIATSEFLAGTKLHLPFFWAVIDYLRKRYTLVDMVKRFSRILFSTFSGLRDKLRKGA